MTLLESIINDLCIELGITDDNAKAIVKVKTENAIREVKNARNYQTIHNEEFIESDIERFRQNIHDLALYDYNQLGAEGQTSHNENSISRAWKARSDCLNGVYPFVGIM